MYNKRDTIGSLILVIVTFITVSLMINMAQGDNITSSEGGYRDKVQVQNSEGHQDRAAALQQPYTDYTRPEDSNRTLLKEDASNNSPQQTTDAQKDNSWRQELDRLNGRLQKWFEKPGSQNSTLPQTESPPEKDKDKNKKVVEPDKVENAKKSVSFKDKMQVLKIIAKVSPGDVYKVSQLINDGVTMEEGKEIDRILKQHLS
ncbi:MAG: hypothetical protein ACOYEJ_02640, partial [Mahellales bacterium]